MNFGLKTDQQSHCYMYNTMLNPDIYPFLFWSRITNCIIDSFLCSGFSACFVGLLPCQQQVRLLVNFTCTCISDCYEVVMSFAHCNPIATYNVT